MPSLLEWFSLAFILSIAGTLNGCAASQPIGPQTINPPQTSENRSATVTVTATPDRMNQNAELRNMVKGFIYQSYNGDGWSIYYKKSEDGPNINLTGNVRDDMEPAWSADGSKIAFVMTYNAKRQIYTINIDGSGLRKLTDSAIDLYSPQWSPDGGKIAFTTQLKIPEANPSLAVYPSNSICVMNIDGTDLRNVTENHEKLMDCINITPVWSPDSKRIAFVSLKVNVQGTEYYSGLIFDYWRASSYPDIFTVNTDGKDLINITRTDKDSEISPAWSPDGQKILFIANRQGGQWLEDNWQVYICGKDGKEINRLGNIDLNWNIIGVSKNFGERVMTYSSASFGPYVSWSPNGRLLSTQALGHLVIAYSDNGTIVGTYPGVSQYYCWSPASNRIAYIPALSVLNKTSGDLMTIDADGSNIRTITGCKANSHLSWHP